MGNRSVAAAIVLTATSAAASTDGVSLVSPAGIVRPGVQAFVLSGDTELSGYPAVFIDWRYGVDDNFDVGLGFGGIDVAFVARVHAKMALWRSDDRRWFLGLQIRLEFKRHKQDPGEAFRPIDDFGFDFAPQLSFAWRLGGAMHHGVYYALYYYADMDIRRGFVLEHYIAPAMLGYEYRFSMGLHLQLDVTVGFELFNSDTAGEPLWRSRLALGYDF